MSQQPFISVIIPARNEQNNIKECLASLEQLNYSTDRMEILLVNDGSTDATKEIISAHMSKASFVYLETQGEGPSKARNVALERAKGEYIAFTDADCIVDREWLRETLKGFSDPSVAGVGGSQTLPREATGFEKKVHSFLSSMHFIGEYMKKGSETKFVKHNASCNVVYRRSVLEEVGGFCENLWPGEDVELDYKITSRGYKLGNNPSAMVQHHRPKNLSAFFKMMKRYGWSQACLVKRYGFFRRLHYLPLAEALLLIGWILLMIYELYWGIGLALGVCAVVVIWYVIQSGFRSGITNFSLLMITILAWNVGVGSYIVGLLKKSFRAIWGGLPIVGGRELNRTGARTKDNT